MRSIVARGIPLLCACVSQYTIVISRSFLCGCFLCTARTLLQPKHTPWCRSTCRSLPSMQPRAPLSLQPYEKSIYDLREQFFCFSITVFFVKSGGGRSLLFSSFLSKVAVRCQQLTTKPGRCCDPLFSPLAALPIPFRCPPLRNKMCASLRCVTFSLGTVCSLTGSRKAKCARSPDRAKRRGDM